MLTPLRGYMAGQKRHWISTVHFTHLGVVDGDEDAFEAKMKEVYEALNADTRIRYACGQLERGEGGRLHAQIYTEWKCSMRRSQVAKVLPSHLEPLRGTRTQARDYCRKSEGRHSTLAEIGDWRPERGDSNFGARIGPKQRALALITQEGLEPFEIAVRDPEAYFTFSTAIHRLYEALYQSGALPERVLPDAADGCGEEE